MGVSRWEITKRRDQGQEGSADLTGLFLKIGQGDQKSSPRGW